MTAFSDIIDFLLSLLSDESARAEYEQDPQGALDRAGLEDVTAQDIRDARLQLADAGAVHATDDGAGSSHAGSSHWGGSYDGDDPVHEIGHTTRHYTADEHVQHTSIDHGTIVSIDDRDTLFFQSVSDDDVTVTDNSVAITDSFNQDNSDDDLVAIQDNDTTVSDDDVTINADDSFNTVDSFNPADSFNEDNDLVAIQDNDVNGGDETLDVDVDAPVADDPEPEAADADADDPDPADDGADPAADDTGALVG